MAGLDENSTLDDVFLKVNDSGGYNSATLSALISPKIGAKFRKSITTEGGSATNSKDMLLQFAESVEQCLIDSHEKLYKSADTGRVTIRSYSAHEMLLKENLFDFKNTLRLIRASRDTSSYESGTRLSQDSIYRTALTPAENSALSVGRYSQASVLTKASTSNEDKARPAGSVVAYEEKMKAWIQLMDVDVDPKMPARRHSSSASTAYHVEKISDSSESDACTPRHDKQGAKKQLSDFTYDNLVTPATALLAKHPNLEYVCFSFQFLIITERLKVTVKNARNLFKTTENENEANSFAEVCLVPGKVQVQTSELVKKSKNPQYQSVFFFRGFCLQEMHQMNLRIRLMVKQNILHRPRIIGEVVVSLENFDLVSETVLDEPLHTRIVPGQSGSIRHVFIK